MSSAWDIVWVCVYVVTMLSSFILNGTVLVAVFKNRPLLLRKRFGVLISLAVADLLKVVPMMAQIIAVILGPGVEGGRTACVVSSTLGLMSIMLTILHLAAESINRLVSIVWPLNYEGFLNSRLYKAAFPLLWLAPSLTVGIPPFIIFRGNYDTYHVLRTKMYACSLEPINEEDFAEEISAYNVYAIVITFFFFATPLAAMALSYSIIFKISLKHISQIKSIEQQMSRFAGRRSSSMSDEIASIGSPMVTTGSPASAVSSSRSRIHQIEVRTEEPQDTENITKAGNDVIEMWNHQVVGSVPDPLSTETPSSLDRLSEDDVIIATNGTNLERIPVLKKMSDLSDKDSYGLKVSSPVVPNLVISNAAISESVIYDPDIYDPDVSSPVVSDPDVSLKINGDLQLATEDDPVEQSTSNASNHIPYAERTDQHSSVVNRFNDGDVPVIRVSSPIDTGPYSFITEFSVLAAWGETLRKKAREEDRTDFSLSHIRRAIKTELLTRKRELKLARILGGLLGSFLVFYIPVFVFSWNNMNMNRQPTEFMFDLGRFLLAWAFLNSTLNPLIYGLRIPELKRSVKKLCRSIKSRTCSRD